jgi:magnesium-transporting ATPase (P-type)
VFNIIGVEGLASKLRTNIDTGLSSNDLDIRVKHFGTNMKDMPPRTPFWTFFIKALDDFMLKFLLVCACVNVGFEVGFADDYHRKTGKYLPRNDAFCLQMTLYLFVNI